MPDDEAPFYGVFPLLIPGSMRIGPENPPFGPDGEQPAGVMALIGADGEVTVLTPAPSGVIERIANQFAELRGPMESFGAALAHLIVATEWVDRLEEGGTYAPDENGICTNCGRDHYSEVDLYADDPYAVVAGERTPDGDQPPTGEGDPLVDVYGATMRAIDELLAEDS